MATSLLTWSEFIDRDGSQLPMREVHLLTFTVHVHPLHKVAFSFLFFFTSGSLLKVQRANFPHWLLLWFALVLSNRSTLSRFIRVLSNRSFSLSSFSSGQRSLLTCPQVRGSHSSIQLGHLDRTCPSEVLEPFGLEPSQSDILRPWVRGYHQLWFIISFYKTYL